MNGNNNYAEITLSNFVITDWALAEYYKTLIKAFNKSTAEYWFNKFLPYSVKVELSIMKKAIHFQTENKKTNISLFDAVGYVFSLEKKIIFVTGDKEFKNMVNVRFIK
ncbi:MAG: hypothetical protein ACMXYG_03465 [Candidatus Woesearchaeota archaeon]